MIEINTAIFSFDKNNLTKPFFSNLDITIQKQRNQKKTAILGPNGSGKTTLLRIIAGLYPLASGTLTIDNVNIAHLNGTKRLKKLSYLPALVDCYLPFTIAEIMATHLDYLTSIGFESTVAERLSELSEFFALPTANQKISTLSSGQGKRLFLTLCLSTNPKYLLLDEPDSHLDIDISYKLFASLNKLNSDSRVIFSTHDINLALRFADEIILINKEHDIEYNGPINTSLYNSLLRVFPAEIELIKSKSSKRIFLVPQ